MLVDVVLPQMGGREVARIARERWDLPVVFISGYSPRGIHTNFVLDEGLELLPKPYELNELLRRVRRVLDQRAT